MNVKTISQKVGETTEKNRAFIFSLLLFLSIDYLVLFFIESILPGYVMDHLNLNFLLLIILGGWLGFSVFFDKKEFLEYSQRTFNLSATFLVTLFFLSTWFTLYRVNHWELIVAFIFLSVIGFLLYKN